MDNLRGGFLVRPLAFTLGGSASSACLDSAFKPIRLSSKSDLARSGC